MSRASLGLSPIRVPPNQGSHHNGRLRNKMELIAITLARVVAFLEVQALDPFGRSSTPEALSNLADRFSFTEVPKSLAEMDFHKGIELVNGTLDGIHIDRVAIYTNGIMIDTRSTTENSERVLVEFLEFAKAAFGATVEPSRKNFVSQIVFRSNLQLALLNPVLAPIAARLSAFVSGELKQPVVYEPSEVSIGADVSMLNLKPVSFTVARRAERPFFENMYFSNAPVRTAEHLELVKQLEEALKP